MTEFGRDQFETHQYRDRLNAILSAQLSPDNIDSYADDALNDVIGLAQDAIQSFEATSMESFETQQDWENAAFAHYGLTNVEQILDHIQAIATELSEIDQRINESPVREAVYVPPDDTNISINPGSGTFQEKRNFPRLKTVLFILSRDFSLDIHDTEQVIIDPSSVRNNMMRRLGYVLLNVPTLHRAVLVCDEEGNASFVFDTELFATLGHTPQSLANLTKSQIRDLLRDHPDGSARLVYDPEHFVEGMRTAIREPGRIPPYGVNTKPENDQPQSDSQDTYLYPDPPDEDVSAAEFAEDLNLDRWFIDQLIEHLTSNDEEFGKPPTARFGESTDLSLSPEQQSIITDFLHDLGYFTVPEGHASFDDMVERLDADPDILWEIIESLDDDTLGQVNSFNYDGDTYSPEQQEIITQAFANR